MVTAISLRTFEVKVVTAADHIIKICFDDLVHTAII